MLDSRPLLAEPPAAPTHQANWKDPILVPSRPLGQKMSGSDHISTAPNLLVTPSPSSSSVRGICSKDPQGQHAVAAVDSQRSIIRTPADDVVDLKTDSKASRKSQSKDHVVPPFVSAGSSLAPAFPAHLPHPSLRSPTARDSPLPCDPSLSDSSTSTLCSVFKRVTRGTPRPHPAARRHRRLCTLQLRLSTRRTEGLSLARLRSVGSSEHQPPAFPASGSPQLFVVSLSVVCVALLPCSSLEHSAALLPLGDGDLLDHIDLWKTGRSTPGIDSPLSLVVIRLFDASPQTIP